MQRKLVIVAGPAKGREFDLADGQTLIIGRGKSSDTKIEDERMSRVHCRVQVDGGKTLIVDADSTGGTLINGEKIKQRELVPGAVFQIGDTQIRYQLEDQPDQATLVSSALPIPKPKPKPEVADESLSDLIGMKLAHYKLEKVIHRGQSGLLFRATDLKNDRPAAVKVLAPELARDEQQRDRFVRAVQTMIDVHHENLVQLYNAGKQGPYCWAAMELVEGSSVKEIIELIGVQGMLDWREAFRVGVHVGRALEAAYQHKIIHRNITPSNLIQRRGDKVVKVCDLMLAKAFEGSKVREVTGPGQLVGEVAFMSPERTRFDEDVDNRSDIYSLGATLYALLTGRPPFESRSLPELVRMIREDEPVKPKERQLSINDRFQDAVLRMLSKNPDDRFQNPTHLLTELESVGRYQGLDADASNWI